MPSNPKTPYDKYKALAMWLTPSIMELAIYIFIALVTLFVSGQDFINQSLFISGDFNPIQAGISSVDTLLQMIVGERIAGSLSLGIFWGLVGLGVNVLWWVGSNFSNELNNDLVFSKYVHPRDTDPRSPLREFVEKTIFRTSAALLAIVYFNLYVSDLFPRITERMSIFIGTWSESKDWGSLIFAILSQMFLIHIFTILVRIILLKKRVF